LDDTGKIEKLAFVSPNADKAAFAWVDGPKETKGRVAEQTGLKKPSDGMLPRLHPLRAQTEVKRIQPFANVQAECAPPKYPKTQSALKDFQAQPVQLMKERD